MLLLAKPVRRVYRRTGCSRKRRPEPVENALTIMGRVLQGLRILRRRLYELLGNPRYSMPSLNELDKKLGRYLGFRNGFFIEAGANDGFSQSNTYYLEKFLGWRGVLVEAVPELYEECKKERINASVHNCALVAGDYAEASIEVHYANLMSLVEGARKSAEAQARHISAGIAVQNLSGSYSVKVPARTLESILDGIRPPPKIDFFCLDVEGYERDVLRGLNLDKYAPIYILVEASYFEEVNSMLEDRYDLVEKMSSHDYLYRLKNGERAQQCA